MLPDLSNERPRFDQRIGSPEGMIWPSDHAGVMARLRIPMVHIDE